MLQTFDSEVTVALCYPLVGLIRVISLQIDTAVLEGITSSSSQRKTYKYQHTTYLRNGDRNRLILLPEA